MRTVSVAALAELSKIEGTEPLIIIGIEWVEGSITYYSDKEIAGVNAKVIDIGALETVVLDNKTSHSVQLTLDDTDGQLKTIIDGLNIHKVNCLVYQYYGALSDLNDKFLLFQGQISTPFTWSEKDRSISFSIVSEIESYEVGFSPEEGQLEFVSDDFVGKPWPLCFGNVVHAPTQKVSQAIEGRILDTVCILDPLLAFKLEALRESYWQEAFLASFYTKVINGTESYAPSVQSVLTPYIQIILQERSINRTLFALITELERVKGLNFAAFEFGKARIRQLEGQLDTISVQSNIIHLQKSYLEGQVALLDFKYRLQKEAFLKIAQCYNNMQQIIVDYNQVQSQICNEQECVINQVRIEGGELFPQGQLVDIHLKDARLRGTFNGQIFTFLDIPTPKYTDRIELSDWQRDDDPCAPTDDSNGLNLFWLKDESVGVNLVGMYILVKKRGEDDNIRHILQVDRQVGRKVYFKLVPYSFSQNSGPPQGLSIDQEIGKLASTPFVPNPWGDGAIPIDLFNGNWDVSAWNQPDAIFLLNLINRIPGGVNQYELELLARMAFLLPTDAMDGFFIDNPDARRTYTVIGEDIEYVQQAGGFIASGWLETYKFTEEEIPETMFWQAQVGDTVRSRPDNCTIYIANILPSTIKAVHAYRTLPNGSRVLAPVPSSYYIKNEAAPLGSITVTALTFPFDLRAIPGESWEDAVYVTLSSSIGPNVTDVIKHLVETYTSATCNTTNFDAIKTKFQDGSGNELYPANFCLTSRPNVLDEIQRIAWEARCAIYRIGNEFFLKYLSEEPTTDYTLTEDNITNDDNLQVSFPQTDNLVTRMVVTWNQNYLPLQTGQKLPRIILRNNVKIYGMHEAEEYFHIYNIKELVYKSATFWMIRRSNTWKHLQCKTFLTNIQLDVLDTILLSFAQKYVCNTDVKTVLQSLVYDPGQNLLSLDVELPVRAGEMDTYPYYWPASLPTGTEWPTPFEIEQGYAGGFGPGSGVKGTIDDC